MNIVKKAEKKNIKMYGKIESDEITGQKILLYSCTEIFGMAFLCLYIMCVCAVPRFV